MNYCHIAASVEAHIHFLKFTNNNDKIMDFLKNNIVLNPDKDGNPQSLPLGEIVRLHNHYCPFHGKYKDGNSPKKEFAE